MDYKTGLMIFRRDLRLDDNSALIHAAQMCDEVIPCFIFDPRQIGQSNDYRSDNAIQFMIESIKDLQEAIKKSSGKLNIFYGKAENVINELLEAHDIDALFINNDYTPFSVERDNNIEKICLNETAAFHAYDDAMLNPPEAIKTQAGHPYEVFTAYWKRAIKKAVQKPITIKNYHFSDELLPEADDSSIKKFNPKPNPDIAVHGGSKEAEKIVRSLKKFEDYAETRDIPSILTTQLSAHNKFGTISIRTLYQAMEKALGDEHPLLRQLYWRDFYMQVAYFRPEVYGSPYREKYNGIKWSRSVKNFEKWCEGKTGFPIVDAGMRQLNKTGFMHNRTRMIVGSFLTKDLHLPWLWGEKYFAEKLVDYDPALNNGNWQWVAGTGCDAAPYFRIFNPWLQQKKFDPECTYIKKWVPELKNVRPKIIHNWFKETSPKISSYPRPMVEHKTASKEAIKLYKAAIKNQLP